ncbi:hypothetical protein GCM10020331_019410 [Ectobacillus funiculus]
MTKALAQALGYRTSFEKVDTNPYLDQFLCRFRTLELSPANLLFLAERFKEQKKNL